MRTTETEVRALLKAIAADPRDTYAPSSECENEVCRILARLENRVVGAKGKANQNGSR